MDDITCKKVSSMMSLYIDDKLNDEHKSMIEEHFNNCPTCYQKYLNMKNIIENLKLSYDKIIKNVETVETASLFNIREYEKFYNNISAYMDNELDYEESVEFRKYLLQSKGARSDLRNMYVLQNHIKDSFTKCILENNINLSKKVISTLKKETKTHPIVYFKVAIIFGLLLFSGSALYLFMHPEKLHHPIIKKPKRVLYVHNQGFQNNDKSLLSNLFY